MTPEELKAWRIKVCTDLANGVQYQMHRGGRWVDEHACTITAGVFNDDRKPETIRIKPEPRKVWVGWPKNPGCRWNEYWIRPGELSPSDLDNDHTWQLVTEERK